MPGSPRPPTAQVRATTEVGEVGAMNVSAGEMGSCSSDLGRGPERWAWVPGYEGLYKASDLGRVMSFPRSTTRGGILKQGPGRYLTVALYKNDERWSAQVHQVILLTFTGPRPPGLLTRHLDGDTHNNRLANLCYGTSAENGQDQMRHGTFARGVRHGLAKLTDANVRQIRQRHSEGEYQTVLAREFGMSQGCISRIVRRVTWTHVQQEGGQDE